MRYEIKKTQGKVDAVYKTIYIRQYIVDKILKIAKDNNTSFNNVVISMIESCLEEK